MRPAGIDELLEQVHRRLRLGIDIATFADGNVEVRWRRDYDGELSDERCTTASTLSAALEAVLEHEDQADELAALES